MLALLSLATLVPALALAQNLIVPYPGSGFLTATGAWRFHTGDDPSWLTPVLDDSTWETISADYPWGAQSHPGYTGFAWYRRSIQITRVTGPLSIYVPSIDGAYELFWNGQRIGSFGHLPPQAVWFQVPQDNVFPLPAPDATGRLRGVLAIRVWKPMLTSTDTNDGGGLSSSPLIGDSEILRSKLDLSESMYERANLLSIIGDFIFLLVAIGAIARWVFDRTQKVQLWLGIFSLGLAVQIVFWLPFFFRFVPFVQEQLYQNLQAAAWDLSSWMLILVLFGLDRERVWRRTTAIIAAIYLLADAVDLAALSYWASGWWPLHTLDLVASLISSLLPAYFFVLLAAGLRRRREPDLIFFGLACAAHVAYEVLSSSLGQFQTFKNLSLQAVSAFATIHLGLYGFNFSAQLPAIVIIAIVYREQRRERRRQLFVESELKSAQEVQHVLVPEETPAIPGFAITSLYWPAGEVGGDMFQVIPGPAGDVLIILADVSGKGLKAAMTVSLLVGAVRTIADITTNPLSILNTLNHRLLGRTAGGFCTCLTMHITSTGFVTLANAGHLPPSLNGKTLPVEGSLPLGLDPAPDFTLTHLQLEECDDLTLYTDGVLEAQSPTKEIFGFERTAALLDARPSVLAIAETARAFGQNDDITVIKIVRNPSRDSLIHIPANLQAAPA